MVVRDVTKEEVFFFLRYYSQFLSTGEGGGVYCVTAPELLAQIRT